VADKEKNEIKLGTLIEWVNDSDDATLDSRANAEKCRDFYDSKQWTEAEAKALRKRKQAPVVINRIKPKVDGLMGMERANRTTAKAYPRTPQHEKAATAATEAVRFVLDDQFYRQTRSAAWDNLCVEGSGGVEVIVKPRGDGFKIFINHIQWDRLIYDPHDRTRDFHAPRYLGQVVWLDYDVAMGQFPDGEDVLESMIEGSTTFADKPTWMDTKRKRVKIVELYYLQDGDWWYACFTHGGFLKPRKKSPYVNEEGETEHPYEFASLFVDREGNRYGATLQYLDVQDEINKRRSKALHLMSVRQVRWERGAVEDINKAREELAKPDGVVETTPGMEFEVLKTGDMAAAQFNLLAEAKQEIDAVGYNAAASGKEPRSMSGIALKNRELAAQTELAPMFDVLKHLDVRVYRKVWNRIKQYWRAEMWIRVTDDPSNLRWVGLNRPMTKGQLALEQAKDAGAAPEQLQQLQAQLAADPTANEPAPMQNEVATLDVDIVIDDAPDSVTMQVEEFQALGEMVKSGIPIPPTAVVAASTLKDKDKILKEMKQGNSVPPEVQEQMKKMQEEGQKLAQENQQLKAGAAEAQAKIVAREREAQMKAQMEARVEQMREQMQAQSREREALMSAQFDAQQARMDAQFERWKALLEARTKIEVAEIGAKSAIDTAEISAAKQATAA
jgi:hypothetical protein